MGSFFRIFDNTLDDDENRELQEMVNNREQRQQCQNNLNDKQQSKCANKKDSVQPADAIFDNWQRRSSHGDGCQSSNKQSNCGQSKESDVLNLSVEAGSLQSGSSRGFSVPPPMRNIGREVGKHLKKKGSEGLQCPSQPPVSIELIRFRCCIGPWRKSTQETSRLSSVNNQTNQGFENQNDHHSPWYWHNNAIMNSLATCPGFSPGQAHPGYNMGPPQSPLCHYHHHGQNLNHQSWIIQDAIMDDQTTPRGPQQAANNNARHCRQQPVTCNSQQVASCQMHQATMCMPPAPGTASDPMLLQQFIQTQQMLINSMSQCNQLLWDQQREINNLNAAVLLVISNMTGQKLYEWLKSFYFLNRRVFSQL